MTPAGFDAAVRTLVRRVPGSVTSGARTSFRNSRVGGNPLSKHLIDMARDIVFDTRELYDQSLAQVKILGLWVELYPEDRRIHVQGLPPGEIPVWWREKFLED